MAVGVGVGVEVGVGVGVNGTCATSSVAGQFFPPVPPTALGLTSLLAALPAVSLAVRLNDVPTETVMTYGESVGAPSRT